MKLTMFAMIVAFGMLTGCQQLDHGHDHAGESTLVDMTAVRQAVEGSNERWIAAAVAGDAAGLAKLYAADAVLMPPNMPRATGRAEIESLLSGMFAEMSFDEVAITIDSIHAAQSGELVWVVGGYSDKVTAGGEQSQDKGKYLAVFKDVDGEWLMVADAWSSNLPQS